MQGILLGLGLLVFIAARVIMIVRAFRTSTGWGLATWFLPFGWIIFPCKHWDEGKGPLLCMLGSGLVLAGVVLTDADFTEAFRRGYAAGHQRAEGRSRSAGPNGPSRPRATHEAHDLAETESVPTPAPVASVDPFAAQRAALAKHNADLAAEYQRLSTERAALKPGDGPALRAFNAKAARYQSGLQALQAEQAQLNSLDHPGSAAVGANAPAAAGGTSAEAEANAALGRLRASVAEGNYAGFAATLRKCLADYQHTAAFPQIATYARQVMRDATPPAKLGAALQLQAQAARAESDATTRQVQAIVNQTPPTVVPPRGSTEVYEYDYHPGATKPDFNVADVVTGREAWNGDYVYMKARPGVFYRSADCEFNPQTKYFFTDRTVPKKKLTDAENQEVVRLYRILGKDETIINTLSQRLARVDQTSTELVALNTQLRGLK